MNLKPVKSSNISALGYDKDKRELHIEFKAGSRYTYHDVSPEAFKALEEADSIGQHVAAHIRSKYKFTRGGAK